MRRTFFAPFASGLFVTWDAGAATRLRPRTAATPKVTGAGHMAKPLDVSPIRNGIDPATRIADLSARLAELEGPAKLENPGIAIDDASVRVNPVTQPILAEYRDVQKELDALNASLASSGGVVATPVLQNEVEPNNTTATANALVFGGQSAATVAGAIGVAGDVDFYSFSATAGSRVWIDVESGGRNS